MLAVAVESLDLLIEETRFCLIFQSIIGLPVDTLFRDCIRSDTVFKSTFCGPRLFGPIEVKQSVNHGDSSAVCKYLPGFTTADDVWRRLS